nr:retrovirus-related Pol polyprotein from transposon TNT 1-94 [Tanacetum cinerariifolium]
SQNNIDDKGYWDSGCSRHMTGNISYLSDYEPFDGGYVSFGQGGYKITGKGTIKTGKLEFENMYFVKDLKTPRQHNMYSIDLNNIVLHRDLTCLVAKASADECMLWHKRLGHLNFKTMNKLVRHNLVRGLPTKCFENDHTCTACLKGKQHKASWIKREFSNARTPQQNGVAKRRNRTLIEAARTMLADAKLPVTFWDQKRVNTACYVQNKVLVNKSPNKTPYELLNGRSPATGFLKPFGCHVMILNTLDNLGKFKEKGDEGYFIGYSISSKAFRVFNKRTRRVEENFHVEFLENKAIEKGTKDATSQDVKKNVSSLRYIALPNWAHDALLESSSSKPQDNYSTGVPEGSGNPNPTASTSNPPADPMEILTVESPIPTSKEVEEQSFIATIHQKTDPALLQFCLFSYFLSQVEPKKISDALQDPSCVESIQEELLQFKIQNVWTLVYCPKGVRLIGTKWVLKNKKDERGIVIKNKARLMAQGHTQEEGIDYDEVFAPVSRIKAIRLFLAYASFMGFTVYQMDVKSAFLYGTIDEEVYVMQPPGFQDPEFLAKVYKVKKAMYGLHQAPRAWYGTLSKYLLKNGFQRALMHEKFQMSAMGELNFFLGLQVLQNEDGIFLSQNKYVGDILKKFRYLDVRSSNTPMDKENPWGKDRTRKDVVLHLYRSMIVSLMYLTASRPNIMFAVCAYARHQVTPKESPFDLVAYSDSDYGGATQDRKSTTGGCQFLGRRLISLQCKKKKFVATSTTEAEYVTAASCRGQVLWIQN